MRVLILAPLGRMGSEIVNELKDSHERRLIDRVPVAASPQWLLILQTLVGEGL